MYHVRNTGTHYEAGFVYGSRLKKHQIYLLDIVPFAIDEKRISFALSCVEHYQNFYPEILQEIKGLADGQEADYEKLLGVLLSMYCIMPDQKCTNVCVQSEAGVFLGRNSDFLVEIEKYTMNCIYRLKGCYTFNGNTTAFVEMEDGMNEHGFAIGLTSVYPTILKPGINAGMLVRYLLEKCKSVEEAIAQLKKLPISSSQTLAMADASGACAIVECNCEQIEVMYPNKDGSVVSTNAFHSKAMKKYALPLGSMGDWHQEERYVDTTQALANTNEIHDVEYMKKLLSGKYGFICQYDRKTGADTVWSVIYDVMHKRIYRVEGNPGRKKFKEDIRF